MERSRSRKLIGVCTTTVINELSLEVETFYNTDLEAEKNIIFGLIAISSREIHNHHYCE